MRARAPVIVVLTVSAGLLAGADGRSPLASQTSKATPEAAEVDDMQAALPAKAMVIPSQLRRVLVFTRAEEYVHSSIPLAAAAIEALGKKTSAFAVTVSDDPADFTTPK